MEKKQLTDPVILVNLGRINSKSQAVKEYIESNIEPKVFCKFCCRELKNEKSKEQGYGQGCYKRWIKGRAHKRSLV